MATLDWSQCPAVESIPGKRSGAWVFKGTRTPISAVFENIEDMSVEELVEEFGVTREQVAASRVLCKRPFFPSAAGILGGGKVGILPLDFHFSTVHTSS